MRIHQMMTRGLLVAGVATGAMMTASASYAAAAAKDSASEVKEVIVTANKREEKLHDVALSVSAINGEDMQRRSQSEFSDIIAQVPGFSMQQLSHGINRLILRGQNAGGAGATVGIVMDDVPLNYSSSLADGSITTQNVDTYDMAQVEVLRGPQGTLYGAGAEAGILKYVTNKPSFAGFAGEIEAGIQDVTHGQTAGNVKGFVNIPLSDTFAIRASAFSETLPGYINNWATGQHNINHGLRQGGRFSALWTPTPDLTVRFTASTQKMVDYGSNSVDAVGAALTPATPPANALSFPKGLSYGAPTAQVDKNGVSLASLDVSYDLHLAKFTSITSYGINNNRFRSDLNGSEVAPGVTYPTALGGVYGKPIALYEDNPIKLHKYTQEFRLSSEPDFKVANLPTDWQLGVFATREATYWVQSVHVVDAANPNGPDLAPAAGDARLNSPYNEVSYFGEATVHFTPQFDVAFGGRTTEVKTRSQINLDCCILFGPGSQLPALHSTQDATTWSVAPRYHWGADTVIYGRVASGFRPGGPELIIPGAPADFPLSYRSDSTVNYEAGLRTYLFDKKVSIDVAAFYIDWSDIQIITQFVSQTTGGTFNVTGNAGDAKSQGVEWTLSWKPIDDLTLNAIGSWTDAELTKDAPTFGGKSGQKLAFVPDIQNTFNFDYQHHAFGDYKYFVGGAWTYTGNQYTDFVSPLSLALISQRIKLDSYSTFALQAGLDNAHYTFEVYVKNLTDERALIGYGSSGAYGLYGSATIIQPRTVGARIAAKF